MRYSAQTSTHVLGHVLNYVSGIKEAPNVDCLQCRSLKMICYIQGMFLKKNNDVSVIFFQILSYYATWTWKHFGAKCRKNPTVKK